LTKYEKVRAVCQNERSLRELRKKCLLDRYDLRETEVETMSGHLEDQFDDLQSCRGFNIIFERRKLETFSINLELQLQMALEVVKDPSKSISDLLDLTIE
jgi:hypothetical protein